MGLSFRSVELIEDKTVEHSSAWLINCSLTHTYRDCKSNLLSNSFYILETKFYRVLSWRVFKMVEKWANVDPRTARFQDLVNDFEILDNVFGRVYKEACGHHIPIAYCGPRIRNTMHLTFLTIGAQTSLPSLFGLSPYTSIKSPATIEKSAVGGMLDGRTSGI